MKFTDRGLRDRSKAIMQIAHYLRTQRGAGLPEWYETRRKTTMVVFWS